MQAKLFLLIEKLLKLREFYFMLVLAVAAWGSYVGGWLTIEITCPLWVHISITATPLLLIWLASGISKRRTRRFKTGDHVRIIADDRHFIAIRYTWLFSSHVVCKLVNDTDLISVNEKYIEPWTDPKVIDTLQFLRKENINRAVPSTNIRQL